jgi:hypothetical protein
MFGVKAKLRPRVKCSASSKALQGSAVALARAVACALKWRGFVVWRQSGSWLCSCAAALRQCTPLRLCHVRVAFWLGASGKMSYLLAMLLQVAGGLAHFYNPFNDETQPIGLETV